MVKAIKYTLKVGDPNLGIMRGQTIVITEIFIPSEKICFNSEKYIFRRNESREQKESKIEEFELEEEFVDKLVNFVIFQECYEEKKEKITNKFESLF